MQDDRIIELYFCRDQRAIAETNAKYGAYCRAVARNILGLPQDVEECVSDTWLQAWNAIPPRRPARLKLFLARICRNLALNRWERERARKRGGGQTALLLEELGECVAPGDDPADEAQARELERHIGVFLSRLPTRDRDLFLRRYFYAESVKDIAARYRLTENQCSAALSRTRKKLRTYLEQEELL